MKNVVVFTGSGISAESGLSTFRDEGGLWEKYDINDVATPEAWARNPQLVLKFYNERISQLGTVGPNAAHLALAGLEEVFNVQIITQNVDNLHERAGSSRVLHLHGELMKCRSTKDARLVYDVKDYQIKWGDTCERGSQLRPHIVWFGEMVSAMEEAAAMVAQADYFLVIGTSLNVYPAASLVTMVPNGASCYLVDPHAHEIGGINHLKVIQQTAGAGVPPLVQELIKIHSHV